MHEYWHSIRTEGSWRIGESQILVHPPHIPKINEEPNPMADLSGTPDGFFRSFWIAGFESACHINRAGLRLDMLATTEHDKQAATDYELLHSVGISTARDGIRWHLIDKRGSYDFSSLAPMVE